MSKKPIESNESPLTAHIERDVWQRGHRRARDVIVSVAVGFGADQAVN